MSAIPKPMPVPGNWMNARPASRSAKAVTMSAKSRAHGWSAQRPPATSSQTIPGEDSEPAPESDSLEDRKVAERAEPVEAEELEAEEQVAEPGQRCEEAEDGDEDGWVLHRSVLPGLPARGAKASDVGFDLRQRRRTRSILVTQTAPVRDRRPGHWVGVGRLR